MIELCCTSRRCFGVRICGNDVVITDEDGREVWGTLEDFRDLVRRGMKFFEDSGHPIEEEGDDGPWEYDECDL